MENCLGKKADYDFQGMQPGDVQKTFAEIERSAELLGYEPTTSIQVGVPRFIEWFKMYST